MTLGIYFIFGYLDPSKGMCNYDVCCCALCGVDCSSRVVSIFDVRSEFPNPPFSSAGLSRGGGQ